MQPCAKQKMKNTLSNILFSLAIAFVSSCLFCIYVPSIKFCLSATKEVENSESFSPSEEIFFNTTEKKSFKILKIKTQNWFWLFLKCNYQCRSSCIFRLESEQPAPMSGYHSQSPAAPPVKYVSKSKIHIGTNAWNYVIKMCQWWSHFVFFFLHTYLMKNVEFVLLFKVRHHRNLRAVLSYFRLRFQRRQEQTNTSSALLQYHPNLTKKQIICFCFWMIINTFVFFFASWIEILLIKFKPPVLSCMIWPVSCDTITSPATSPCLHFQKTNKFEKKKQTPHQNKLNLH